MKVFVSHSIYDKKLIQKIKAAIEPNGINLIIAEHHYALYKTITEKIKDQIRSSDFALILLTKNGFNSNFVQQEIGFIENLKKPYIQLVQKGIEKKITGFNFGRDFISYDPREPEEAVNLIKQEMTKYLNRRHISNKNKPELTMVKEENQQLKIGIGFLAVLLIFGLFFSD